MDGFNFAPHNAAILDAAFEIDGLKWLTVPAVCLVQKTHPALTSLIIRSLSARPHSQNERHFLRHAFLCLIHLPFRSPSPVAWH